MWCSTPLNSTKYTQSDLYAQVEPHIPRALHSYTIIPFSICHHKGTLGHIIHQHFFGNWMAKETSPQLPIVSQCRCCRMLLVHSVTTRGPHQHPGIIILVYTNTRMAQTNLFAAKELEYLPSLVCGLGCVVQFDSTIWRCESECLWFLWLRTWKASAVTTEI